MPVISEGIIGDGFEGVERADSIWQFKDDVDLFVFPDIGFAPEQMELLRQGKIVWGSRRADALESNRGLFLRTLKEIDLPCPKFEVVNGMNRLRDYLKDKEDKFIKVSRWRGDFETLHWIDWKDGEMELDRLAVRFGATKNAIKFYVFDPIPAEIEDGIDTYCIDGQWPSLVLHGMEKKDKSFIGTITPFKDVPGPVRMVNEAFGPVLGRYGYRGAFSTEVRIDDKGESYFIDPTCRFPSPPYQIEMDLFGNFSDIIWQGANGVLIDPEPTAEFGVQAVLKMDKNVDDWAAVKIPESVSEQVKGAFCCEIDGALCFPPSPMGNMVAWLTATGDTLKEAIQNLQGYKDELGDAFTVEDKSLADLLVEINAAEDAGMKFSDSAIPEPSIILEK